VLLRQSTHWGIGCRGRPLVFQNSKQCEADGSPIEREVAADGLRRRSSYDGFNNFIYPGVAVRRPDTSLEEQRCHRLAGRFLRHICGVRSLGDLSKRACHDRSTAGKSKSKYNRIQQ
jgi:hypothetical protein